MEMHKARSGAINSQAELLALQKRARRRLVIACVITFISVSVMWRVRETVPRDVPLPESVIIVGDNLPADLVAAQAANETPPQPNEPIEGVLTTPATSATAAKPAQPPAAAQAQAESVARDRATEEADAAPQPLPPSAVTPVAKLKESSPHAASSGSIKAAASPAAKPEPKPEKSTPTEKPAPRRDPAAILSDSTPRSSSSAKDSSHEAPSKKLPNKEPEPVAKKPEKSEPSSGGRRYTVQIAALSDDSKAQDLKNKLMAMGVNAQITQVETSKGHINRIRTGSFSSEEEARKVLVRIQQAGVSGIIVNQ